jgi:hypothetical protein
MMPFNDPHTYAPLLWAWRDAEGYQFECSAARVDLDTRNRLGLEAWLLWQHRLEHGSTLCNFGRFHPHYVNSSDRKTQRRGGRLGHGADTPDLSRLAAGVQNFPSTQAPEKALALKY